MRVNVEFQDIPRASPLDEAVWGSAYTGLFTQKPRVSQPPPPPCPETTQRCSGPRRGELASGPDSSSTTEHPKQISGETDAATDSVTFTKGPRQEQAACPVPVLPPQPRTPVPLAPAPALLTSLLCCQPVLTLQPDPASTRKPGMGEGTSTFLPSSLPLLGGRCVSLRLVLSPK